MTSPLSQHSANSHSVPAPGMTQPAVLPFKFRPRRESVDWRRIGAVDIDLVVSQVDVDALQEHISTVTFCSLDGERCQRCQSPVDSALVKLLQLAQLTVEWLLHCQDFLTLNLRAAEERLAAAGREREQLLDQQKKQEEKVTALSTELKQRKKIIRTQQSLLAPRIISSQKVLLTRCTLTLWGAPVTICISHMCSKQTASSFTPPPPLLLLRAPTLSLFPGSIHGSALCSSHGGKKGNT